MKVENVLPDCKFDQRPFKDNKKMVDERRRLLPPRLDDTEEEAPCSCCQTPRYHNSLFAKATVLATVAFERLAFYSISGNLILFLNGTKYNWSSFYALDASFFFLGIACIFYFFGGVLADFKFGRFRIILTAFIIYIVGYTTFPVLSNPDVVSKLVNSSYMNCTAGDTTPSEGCQALIFVGLTIVGVGTGMLRANIAPFGADQLKGEGSNSSVVFFNWYYWCINVGTLAALGGIAYVQQGFEEEGFYYGYLISMCCLGAGLVIFLSGKCTYVYRRPVGSIFANIFKIVREAWRMKKRKKAQQFEHRLEFQRGRANVVETPQPSSFLDHAKFRFGGTYHDNDVDDVKQLGKILVVFAALVPYWMVYYQMETTFLIQGLHMKLYMEKEYNTTQSCTQSPDEIWYPNTKQDTLHKFKIAVVWLTLFDVVLLILLIPIMDRIIYPWIREKGWKFTMVMRIMIGFGYAVAAIFVAGLLEHFRLKKYWDYSPVGNVTNDTCCYSMVPQQIQKGVIYYAADISIFWQIPQYCLIGFSEIFTSIAGLEFASMVAPRSMKSSVMGLFYFFSGLGSFLGFAIIYAFQNVWFFTNDHGNINCKKGCYDSKGSCHLDFYFYFLGGVQFFGIPVFYFIVKKLKIEVNPENANAGDNATRTRRNTRHVNRSHGDILENTLISDRPTTPKAVFSDTESGTSESGSSAVGYGATQENKRQLNKIARRTPVIRTIHRDSSGRIGAAVNN